MKKSLFFLSALFCAAGIFAQTVEVIETVAGKNFIDGRDIIATEYFFPENIFQYDVSPGNNTVTVQLREFEKDGETPKNKGKLFLFDLQNNKTRWEKKMFYLYDEIYLTGDKLINTDGANSYYLDNQTGKNRWKTSIPLFHFTPDGEYGFGYQGHSTLLVGVDLNDGKKIWKRKVPKDYGWNDVITLNDSVIVIASSGVHLLNLKNGEGWDYKASTGTSDVTEAIATNVAGLAIGVVTGAGFFTAGYNIVTDLSSNLASDNNNIYYASKDKIVSLKKNDGTVNWELLLNKDLTSKSSIFLKDSLLYQINEGYAYLNGEQVNYGLPYIAVFNPENGELLKFDAMNWIGYNIKGFDANDSDICLLRYDGMAKYSFSEGKVTHEKPWNAGEYGNVTNFLSGRVYIKAGSTFYPLLTPATQTHYLYTDKNLVVEIDENLDVASLIDLSKLYVCYYETDNYRFLAKKGETTVIDRDGNEIAVFEASREALPVGNKLYDMQGKRLWSVDISEFTGH